MIKLCKDSKDFLSICDKIEEMKDVRLTENILYNCMIAGLYNNTIFTYVSFDDNMNGCLVLFLTKDQIGELTLGMLFTWIDAHYPELHKEFIEIASKKAKELKAKKISFITNRNEKVINRRVGKYGFKKTCSIFEKEVV